VSVEAITWALKQPVKQSSAKFVLVVLANCAHRETSFAFPSAAYIAEATSQDRKTVLANLRRLVEWGFIEDTKERRGTTRQIVVYRLCIEVQRDGDLLTERHYCYRSEEPSTGRYYLGVRSCLGEPTSDAGYVGSGRWVQELAMEGVKPVKTVLSVFGARVLAEDAERKIIQAAIADPLCMNRVVPPERTEIGTLPNGAENGTVKKTTNSPKNAQKGAQKRDTEALRTGFNRKERATRDGHRPGQQKPGEPSGKLPTAEEVLAPSRPKKPASPEAIARAVRAVKGQDHGPAAPVHQHQTV